MIHNHSEPDAFIDNFLELEKLKSKGVKIAAKAVDELELLLGSDKEYIRFQAAQEIIRLASMNTRKLLEG